MTVQKFIEQLQTIKSPGDVIMCTNHGAIAGFDVLPGGYDGYYEFLDDDGRLHITKSGTKAIIQTTTLYDMIETLEGDLDKVQRNVIIDPSVGDHKAINSYIEKKCEYVRDMNEHEDLEWLKKTFTLYQDGYVLAKIPKVSEMILSKEYVESVRTGRAARTEFGKLHMTEALVGYVSTVKKSNFFKCVDLQNFSYYALDI